MSPSRPSYGSSPVRGAGPRTTSAPVPAAEPAPVAVAEPAATPEPASTPAPEAAAEPASKPAASGGGLLRSSAVMAAGTAASRLLGFARTWLLSVAIGASYDAANAFQLSNTLPNLIYMLTAGGILNAVLVPQIVRATKQPDGGREYVNRLFTWSFTMIAVVTVVAVAASPWLIQLMARTHNPSFLGLAVAFGYWCVPQVLFYGLYIVFGQYLNAHGRFGAFMWAPVANNVIGLAGLALFIGLYGPAGFPNRHPAGDWTTGMVAVLAGSATLGIVAQALILLPSLRRAGFSYRPRFGVRGVGLRSATNVAGWMFLYVAVGQVAYLVSTWAATPDTGDQTVPGIFTIATALLLMMLPHSLVGVSLVTALFTPLSASARDGDWAAIRSAVSLGLRNVGLFNVAATAGLVALALPIGAVFSSSRSEADGMSWVIAARGLGLVFFTGTYLLQRVCYAYEDAKTPFLTQIPGVVLVVLGSLIATQLPVQWIAAAVSALWSISALLNLLLTAYVLRRQHGSLDLRRVSTAHLRMLAAGVVAGAVGGVTGTLLFGAFADVMPLRLAGLLTTVIAGLVLLGVYAAGLWALKAPELQSAAGLVRRRLGRPAAS